MGILCMKKIIFFIIVLIILGSLGFYFGKVSVLPGNASMIYSRLSGLLPDPALPEKYNWTWQKLIPGDITVYTYPLGKQSFTVPIVYSLPVVKLPMIKDSENFKIKLNISIDFTVSVENTVQLAKKGITNLKKLMKLITEKSKNILMNSLANKINDSIKTKRFPDSKNLVSVHVLNQLKTSINSVFKKYKMSFDNLQIFTVFLPDMKKYMVIRNTINQLQANLLNETRIYYSRKNKIAMDKFVANQKINELKDIAKLIRDYPSMLKYFTIKKLSDKIKLVIIPSGNNQLNQNFFKSMFDDLKKSLEVKKNVKQAVKKQK